MFFKVTHVGLHLLKKDEAQCQQGLLVEVFFHVLRSLDQVEIKMDVDLRLSPLWVFTSVDKRLI